MPRGGKEAKEDTPHTPRTRVNEHSSRRLRIVAVVARAPAAASARIDREARRAGHASDGRGRGKARVVAAAERAHGPAGVEVAGWDARAGRPRLRVLREARWRHGGEPELDRGAAVRAGGARQRLGRRAATRREAVRHGGWCGQRAAIFMEIGAEGNRGFPSNSRRLWTITPKRMPQWCI